MKKKYLIIGAIIVVLLVIVSFVSSNLFNSSDLATNEIPMYGYSSHETYVAQRTPAVAKVDDDFVIDIVDKKGSIKAAFEDAMTLAWSYLREGDSRTAMKRCNQAWLIDHINFNVDWCYGAVLGSMGKNIDAVPYFDKALNNYSKSMEIYPDDYLSLWRDAGRLFTILSDAYLTANDAGNTKKYSEKAITLLSNFLKDPKAPKETIPNVSSLLISAFFNNGEYQKARVAYTELIKKYPEIQKDFSGMQIDKVLKEKGY